MVDIRDFNLFFEEFFESLYRFTLNITQETFIKLYEKRSDFDLEEKAKSFAYITAKNKSLDYLKHRKVEEKYSKYLDPETEEASFVNEVTYQETIRIVRQAVEQLPPQCRAVILHNLNGKGNQDIADEMGISINTVKTQKKIAYKLLREILGSKHFAVFVALFMNRL
jgi:RNA polymerase sigma factor (sigma-70 family)